MQQANLNQSSGRVSGPAADLASVINQCYQCGKCSAGCPVAAGDGPASPSARAACGIGECGAHSRFPEHLAVPDLPYLRRTMPNGIDVPALLDPIRHEVLRKNISTRESQVPAFHAIFMKNIRTWGRVHELSLIGMYKMKTKTYFSDMELAGRCSGKAGFTWIPHRSGHLSEVKEVFKQSSFK